VGTITSSKDSNDFVGRQFGWDSAATTISTFVEIVPNCTSCNNCINAGCGRPCQGPRQNWSERPERLRVKVSLALEPPSENVIPGFAVHAVISAARAAICTFWD